MKFEKLNLDAFSKEKLTDNKLRSINGGIAQITLTGKDGSIDGMDVIAPDGETSYDDYPYTDCDVEHN